VYNAALKSFELGRMDAAERRCRKALSADPAHADSLHLLGLIHAATNRLDAGIELIAQAIRNNPANPEYFLNLGTLLQRQGRLDEALKSYDLALKLKPDFVGVWIRLGDLLTKQKRFDEAILTYGHVLTLDAGNADAANKSAQLLKELNRYGEALSRFELLATLTDDAEAFGNMGVCLCNLNRREEAITRFQRAIEIDAGNLDAHNGLGVAMIGLQRSGEALAPLESALKIKPDFTAALSNLGLALINLRRFDEALPVLDRALAISPDSASLLNNKGIALRGLGRHSDALPAYDRAIALKPDYVEAHYNRGCCLDDMLRGEEALSSFRNILAFSPDHGDAHWNIAINRLRAGDFRTGLTESEWRWKCSTLGYKQRKFARPLWLGREPIEGKTLLIHNDQGLGDALQFCRYAPLAAARGARVILEIDQPLRDLLSTVGGISEIISKGEALPDFDTHCPLGSLPLAFDTTLETIPSDVPYLSFPGNAGDWHAWLGERKGPRIGLVWSGNPTHPNDHNRSIALETLLPLLDVEAQFISLQKDLRPGDAAILRTRSDIRDAGSELKSFTDTAALLSRIDLLITVDTSVAHLAGALGRPAWVLLPRLPDWRWMLDREDNPWYPSLRLFRQTETATWPPVVQRVKEALQEFVAGGEPSIVRALV
jgi:tetratricopeptide (TPR) repeat protein